MTTRLLGALILFAACSSNNGGGDDVTCGPGTTLMGSTCQPDTGDTTCGAGTHLMGTMCVPDDASPAGAPTVTAIDPPAAGIMGLTLFTITGTGFVGSNVSDLHVYFGVSSNPDCEAQLGAVTATTISGEVPEFCGDLNVTVTVVTTVGSATIPFHYVALFTADGDGGDSFENPGDLYLIDPFTLTFVDMGELVDANTEEYGLSGIAFGADGTLWGVSTGDSPADLDADTQSQLVSITFGQDGSPVVTPIGETANEGNEYIVSDIKMKGTTLYGLAYVFNGEDGYDQVVVTISTTDGTVTELGSSVTAEYDLSGGLAIDSNGVVYVAAEGAGAEEDVGSTGVVDTVNTTTGALTATAMPLDGPGAPIRAMTFINTNLAGVVDLGTYGDWTAGENGPTSFGEQLAAIDPTTGDIEPVAELPAQIGQQSHVDAMDFPPDTFMLGRTLTRRPFTALKAAASMQAAHRSGAKRHVPTTRRLPSRYTVRH